MLFTTVAISQMPRLQHAQPHRDSVSDAWSQQAAPILEAIALSSGKPGLDWRDSGADKHRIMPELNLEVREHSLFMCISPKARREEIGQPSTRVSQLKKKRIKKRNCSQHSCGQCSLLLPSGAYRGALSWADTVVSAAHDKMTFTLNSRQGQQELRINPDWSSLDDASRGSNENSSFGASLFTARAYCARRHEAVILTHWRFFV